jgi:hypothetical protein
MVILAAFSRVILASSALTIGFLPPAVAAARPVEPFAPGAPAFLAGRFLHFRLKMQKSNRDENRHACPGIRSRAKDTLGGGEVEVGTS